MTSISEISSVAYKKGNWMRYTLWGVAVVCIGVLIYSFITAMSGNVSASVPEGYRFSVTDNYVEGSKNRTTYYIYDDRILVEDESFNDDSVNHVVIAYDGINTTSLKNDNDTMELCELGSCAEKPKILVTIKKIISRRVGREYIGL